MADTGRHRDREIPTEAEIALILAQCSRRAPTGVRDRALITVMYRAGLRVSEALALKVPDIDMAAGTLRVQHGKGDKFRTVGIGDGALAVLQLWLDCRKRLLAEAGKSSNGRPVFCTLALGPLSANQVRQMLARRAANAGIERHVHPHALRHAHTLDLVRRNVPAAVIQRQLGHSSLSTTDTYLRGIAPADVIAVGRADDWTDDSALLPRPARPQRKPRAARSNQENAPAPPAPAPAPDAGRPPIALPAPPVPEPGDEPQPGYDEWLDTP